MYCATHPATASTGHCAACHQPFCAACVVEDLGREEQFCSAPCADARISGARTDAGEDERFAAGIHSPIRTGWRLWLGAFVPLTLQVALPISAAMSLLIAARAAVPEGPELHWLRVVFGLIDTALFGMLFAGSAVVLSRAHTRSSGGHPLLHASRRFVPWAIAWSAFFVGSIGGALLLIVPGIILGARLYWADEFALIHGHGPMRAIRESFALTRGLVGRIFGFQFVLGIVENAVLIGLVALLVSTGIDLETADLTTVIASTFLISLALAHFYASAHAPEVVYFYALRALRNTLPPEDIHGEWVSRALRRRAGRESAADRERKTAS